MREHNLIKSRKIQEQTEKLKEVMENMTKNYTEILELKNTRSKLKSNLESYNSRFNQAEDNQHTQRSHFKGIQLEKEKVKGENKKGKKAYGTQGKLSKEKYSSYGSARRKRKIEWDKKLI